MDPLLKLGDAQQSAGRAWRALHWAAGRGEATGDEEDDFWKLEDGTSPHFLMKLLLTSNFLGSWW